MTKTLRALVASTAAAALLACLQAAGGAMPVRFVPQYTRDGQLEFPASYRTWPFLTTGFDMSYSAGSTPDHHMFDNVFVDPHAYASFARTGRWPDKTVLVLEHRAASSNGSINKHGYFQREDMDVEIHVRDDARFAGRWAFFSFGPGGGSSPMIPAAASCYACHSAHGAVDTTFVQFYPTLLPIAERNRTVRR